MAFFLAFGGDAGFMLFDNFLPTAGFSTPVLFLLVRKFHAIPLFVSDISIITECYLSPLSFRLRFLCVGDPPTPFVFFVGWLVISSVSSFEDFMLS